MLHKDEGGIANSVDPDQTAPLFAQASTSENLGSLRYVKVFIHLFDRLEDANEYHIRAKKAKHHADAMVRWQFLSNFSVPSKQFMLEYDGLLP